MRETLDGCPEFDGRVLEAAFGATDATLRAHLDRCPRCRNASAHYGRAAAALEGRPVPPLPPPARSPLGPGIAVALVAGLLGVGFLIARPGAPKFEADAGPGAKVRIAEGRRAEVRAGRVRFRVSGAPAVVETPQGEVRAEEADFTVEVEETWRDADAGEDAAMTGAQKAGTAVTVAVAAGVVWWMARDGAVEVPAGRTESRPKPAGPVATPAAPATPPALAEEIVGPAETTPPTGASASGRILDEETGSPVAGARVSLTFTNYRRPAEEEPSATTDAAGGFRMIGITGQGASSEMVLVKADGYAEGLFPAYEAREAMRKGDHVELGEFRLARGARVEGRVLTRDGKPVAGARILFCRDTPETFSATFSPAQAVEAGRSDAEGWFVLPRVPPCRNDVLLHTVYSFSPEGFGWVWLPILAGRKDLKGQDIVLAATAAIAVEVKDADGKPIANAGIVAEPHFRPLGTGANHRPDHRLFVQRPPEIGALFMATTNGDGKATLPRLPLNGESCVYDVVARQGGLAPGWKDGVRLTPGAEAAVTVILEPAKALSVSGTVRNREGEALAGVEVNVLWKKARTDEEGRYRVEGIDPSTADPFGFGEVDAPGYAVQTRYFSLSAPPETDGIDFVLDPALPVEGRVVDDAGAPVAGATVALAQHIPRPDGAIQVTYRDSTRTGNDGRFILARVSAGECRLHASPPEPREDWDPRGPVEARGGDRAVEIILHRAPAVTCRITAELYDPDTGGPLDPDQAMLVRDEPVKVGSIRFDFIPQARMESGRVVFEKCRPGDWILWVRSKGRPPAFHTLTIRDGQSESRRRVPVPVCGTIRGRVEFPGVPPERRMVLVVRLPGEERSRPSWVHLVKDIPGFAGPCIHVEEDGTFSADEVVPGRFLLTGEFTGYRVEGEVEVPAGGVGDVVLRPRSMGRIRFRSGGTTEAGSLVVSVSDTTGMEPRRWHFGGRRARDLDWTTNVEPGTVRWKAEFRKSDEEAGDFGPPAEGEVSVAAGEVKEVVIPAPR